MEDIFLGIDYQPMHLVIAGTARGHDFVRTLRAGFFIDPATGTTSRASLGGTSLAIMRTRDALGASAKMASEALGFTVYTDIHGVQQVRLAPSFSIPTVTLAAYDIELALREVERTAPILGPEGLRRDKISVNCITRPHRVAESRAIADAFAACGITEVRFVTGAFARAAALLSVERADVLHNDVAVWSGGDWVVVAHRGESVVEDAEVNTIHRYPAGIVEVDHTRKVMLGTHFSEKTWSPWLTLAVPPGVVPGRYHLRFTIDEAVPFRAWLGNGTQELEIQSITTACYMLDHSSTCSLEQRPSHSRCHT